MPQPKPKKSKTAVKKKDDSPAPKSSGGVKVGNEVRFEVRLTSCPVEATCHTSVHIKFDYFIFELYLQF